jgi:hypothetical protein
MKQRFAFCLAFVLLLPVFALAQARKSGAAAPAPLATRELDVEGVVAEVIESVRKDDVLTVRVRLRNTGAQPAKVMLARGGMSYHTANYIVAGDTKYEIMRDTAGNVIATPRDGGGWLEAKMPPKGTFAWWAKYPAPPASEKSYTLYLNVGPPIEDVPIIDKQKQ